MPIQLDKDDKKVSNNIRKVVNGNKGISLEEIAETLDESTDLVLNYIETIENVVEYKPNKFKLNKYYWLNDKAGIDYVDDKTFISKESACEYLFNSVLVIGEDTRKLYKQGDIDLQVETAKEYGYYLLQE